MSESENKESPKISNGDINGSEQLKPVQLTEDPVEDLEEIDLNADQDLKTSRNSTVADPEVVTSAPVHLDTDPVPLVEAPEVDSTNATAEEINLIQETPKVNGTHNTEKLLPEINKEKELPTVHSGSRESVNKEKELPAAHANLPEIVTNSPLSQAPSSPTSATSGTPSVTPNLSATPFPPASSTSTISPRSNSIPSSKIENPQIFKKTFELILNHKSTKKNEHLKAAVEKALGSSYPGYIFEALKLTCETSSSNELKAKAVGLFAAVFDNVLFEDDVEKVQFTDACVDVISECFKGEGTDPEVELQVARVLLRSILVMPCHGASLLKAVRQIYNVFIFSLTAANQSAAQATLTQVISAIFQRITDSGIMKGKSGKASTTNLASVEDLQQPVPEKLTLKTLEKLNDDSYDDDREANYTSTNLEDLCVKDAFLIFRAMCKLSVKSLESESLDMKSHAVRSKLLSLHIIHTVLKGHIEILLSHDVVMFTTNSNEETRLISAVRQYICLSLSRNAASPIAPVFELSLEIFWLIISNLRSEFKREIPVFWDEIYLPVAEMKTSTPHQKRYLLSIIERLCNDSRCIIEFYLNYDCDTAMPNICEKIIDYLTKLSLIRVETTQQQKLTYYERQREGISVYDVNKIANLTSSTMSSKPPEPEVYSHFPLDFALKMTSIGCSVAFLRSLHSWAHKGMNNTNNLHKLVSSSNLTPSRNRSDTAGSTSSAIISRNESFNDVQDEFDDPEQFENLKQRKKSYLEGIKQFNVKPKKGIKFFIENGFIESDEPGTIAKFLLESTGLDKAAIGEYLGEGDEAHVATMHAFVDLMDFENSEFVPAMRTFLQAFRLPGEAQKIDRYMLKFAERYVLGNPNIFSQAESAYILSYSVILLNTDLHSPQIKRRMTYENFVSNNAGIDDGKDLPRDFLLRVYEEIQNDEIKLKSEHHAALLAGDVAVPGNGSVGFFGSRDLNREAYIHASKEMSTKTEKLVRSLGKKLKGEDNSVFYAASNVHHVKSIFDTLWMSILAGLTPPFKEYDEEEITKTCLEGIKFSIRIACMFDLDYARTSFMGALVQFENLNNYEEIKAKNVDAIYIMLELSVSEGNNLGSSWSQVLTSISQLERLILIAQGFDGASIPDVSSSKVVRGSVDSSQRTSSSFFSQFTTQISASQNALNRFHNQHLTQQAAQLLDNSELELAIDKVFTNSANLSGENILAFVKALAEVVYEEIESSGQSNNPRTFSLQKVVDICYYNMSRIRLEWSQLWAVMGEIFNNVACHKNLATSFFALDSLKQLSMRFLEIDELLHFKFQKEFLKPFEYVIHNNNSLEVKQLVLECINNMILARARNIKSGWKTIFGVLTVGARANDEKLVLKSYKMANWINKNCIEQVKTQDSFSELVVCFTQLAKNERFQKVSLLSLDVLQKLINDVAKLHDGKFQVTNETLVKLWFPVLFGFHDILMTGEELEVRSRALSYLFTILMQYGEYFEYEFWDLINRELLFPIFSILEERWELSVDDTSDRVSVWLSTTLIQALKSLITLFTHYFDFLSRLLDGYLNLIISCICQENDTIASIGRECFSTLLIDNAAKFNDAQWKQITEATANLFDLTTAKELFSSDPLLQGSQHSNEDTQLPRDIFIQDSEARLKKSKEKSSIVLKSVLQLLLIQTVSELFENDTFYEAVPHNYLMQLADLLLISYNFAKKFNDDYDLRLRLWNAKVIERLPNLLKQESSSSAVLINIMFRMYCDDDKTDDAEKRVIMQSIIPLCDDITEKYAEFDESNQQRNITTWKPVIVEIFQGYVELDDDDFTLYAPTMYSLTLRLFSKSMSEDLREAIRTFLTRVGVEFVKVEKE